MDTKARLTIFAIVEKNHGVKVNEGHTESMVGWLMWFRLCRLRTVPLLALLTRLNACVSLSWPDNSFRQRSRVAQLKLGPALLECTLWMLVRMCGEPDMSLRAGQTWMSWQLVVPDCAALGEPVKCGLELYQRWPLIWSAWVCVRNKFLAGWNRFESSSLSDSEKLS